VSSDACRECPSGQDSTNGSRVCTFCSSGYSRPAADSAAADCSSCDVIQGVTCARNTTTATLNVTAGCWRHSDQTLQTWYCKHSGDWSPCVRGADAGHEGDGYCAKGYRGPRCELCDRTDQHSRYFDKLDATCRECRQTAAQSAIVAGSLPLIVIIVTSAVALNHHNNRRSKLAMKTLRWIHRCQRLWRKAGMRFKLKAAIGFYQCLTAIPSVYNVTLPPDLDHLHEVRELPHVSCAPCFERTSLLHHSYTTLALLSNGDAECAHRRRWMHVLEFMSEMGADILIPADCVGTYRSRLLISSCWPIALLLVAWIALLGWELANVRALQGLSRRRRALHCSACCHCV
jgi:hypothetical protein